MQSNSTLPFNRRIPTLDGARARGIHVQFYDPDGHRYGLPHLPLPLGTQVSVHRCSAPFFLSTWKRVGVIQREHADPGLTAGVRFRARRHREHGAARCRSQSRGHDRMRSWCRFPGG